jgi:hypothetical protein
MDNLVHLVSYDRALMSWSASTWSRARVWDLMLKDFKNGHAFFILLIVSCVMKDLSVLSLVY